MAGPAAVGWPPGPALPPPLPVVVEWGAPCSAGRHGRQRGGAAAPPAPPPPSPARRSGSAGSVSAPLPLRSDSACWPPLRAPQVLAFPWLLPDGTSGEP